MFDPYTLRKLITEHGVTVTLRKKSTGAYNTTTGKVTQTNTDYTVQVYFFNNDPSVGQFSIAAKAERRAVVSDRLSDGSNTPDIDSSDELIFQSNIITVTRSSKITSSTSNMCQLLYLQD